MIIDLNPDVWPLQASLPAWQSLSPLGGDVSAPVSPHAWDPLAEQGACSDSVRKSTYGKAYDSADYYRVVTTFEEALALDVAEEVIRDELTNFLSRPDTRELVGTLFGEFWHHDDLVGTTRSFLTGAQAPCVEVIATPAMTKAFQASYSTYNNTIYFDRDFLALTTPEELVAVYLEELGHYWQSQTGDVDIAGDEGALLAALILKKDLDRIASEQIEQEDDRGWLLLDGQCLAIEKASWLQTDELQVAESRSGIFYLPKSDPGFLTTLGFQARKSQAQFRNEVGLYFTDSLGRVDGILPGQEGYTEAVLRQRERRILFNPDATEGNWQEVVLEGGVYFGMYLIADSSSDKILKMPTNYPARTPVYFSEHAANPDGEEHMRWQSLGNGILTMQWEDLWDGGDNDFNDAVYTMEQKGIRTPGNAGQLVPFYLDWISSEAAYLNEMGYYYVDDAEGRINGIAPGDTSYAQEVFKAGNYQVVFGQGAIGTNRQFTLAGGRYIGLYLIANGNSDTFLRGNPANQPGVGAHAYFSYQRANPTHISNLSPYTGAQWGWEDALTGGDKDYNDLIFNLSFGPPRDVRVAVDDVVVVEPVNNEMVVEFTLNLSEAHLNPVTVSYETVDQSAVAGLDYLFTRGSVAFAPGVTEQRVAVTILADTFFEQTETFGLQLSGVANAQLSDGFALGFINDPGFEEDEPPPPANLKPVVRLANVVDSLAEDTDMRGRRQVADIIVSDDSIGNNQLSLSGNDAFFFEIDDSKLYLSAGTVLDFEAKAEYAVSVNVDDIEFLDSPDDSASYTLAISAVLKEEANFNATLRKEIPVPASPSVLLIKLDSLNIDNMDTNSMNDAFELEFVDASGRSLVPTIGHNKTAFFNITEEFEPELAAGVTFDAAAGIVSVSLVGLEPNTVGNLALRFVNNDHDTASQVRILGTMLREAPAGSAAPVAASQTTTFRTAALRPNLSGLVDVSNSIQSQYQRTSLNQRDDVIYADVSLQNRGTYGVNTTLLLAVKNISDPSVQVRDADGLTLDSLPYYDFSTLLTNGRLDPNQATDSRSLVFYNPNNTQFDYELVVLSSVNHNPLIMTRPELEIVAGQLYHYNVDAVDPDSDPLSYRLLVAPQGMSINAESGLISWHTSTSDIGNQTVITEVKDDRGGFARQSYTLSITEAKPNRPPLLTSTPIVDARVNGRYFYDVEARDADGDVLRYELVEAPVAMSIDSDTGIIQWLPSYLQMGSHPIHVKVTDGRGGAALQTYQVLVLGEVANRAPIITSTPVNKAVAGLTYSYQVMAQDADNDTLTYELSQDIHGISLDSTTGLLSFTPDQATIGNQLISIVVRDGRGGEDSQAYLLDIEGSFVFTDDEDWRLGTVANLNFNKPDNDQLQLDSSIETLFNYIWVSLSGRDAVVRINTDYHDLDDGVADKNNYAAVLGEYLTRPNGMGGNPSRTTVDRNGDVWVGNRNEGGSIRDANGVLRAHGSVTKVSASVTGDSTSTGVWNAVTGLLGTFDRRPWTNTGGADTDGGTETAADQAILQYVRIPDGDAIRHLSVDADNNIWVGGYPFTPRSFSLLDGENGIILDSFNARSFGAGGYGGLIDGNGILWSASLSENALLRFDPVTRIAKRISVPNSYGLGIDSRGNIWNTNYYGGLIYKITPDGAVIGVFSTGGRGSSGVATTSSDNHVWIANRESNTVTRLDNNGSLLASIPVGVTPTGVSIDSNGKVWVANLSSDNIMRVDPKTNKVDLTVYLGPDADPYNYSDMTGSVVTGVTIPTGTWRTTVDGGKENQRWEKLLWNTESEASIPSGSKITVEIRAADSLDDLANHTWQFYDSGSTLNLTGRYAEIRATLAKTLGPGAPSPVLSDIRLTTLGADSPNVDPIISSTPRTSIAPSRAYQYLVQAQDANGDLLSYSLLGNPVGMTLEKNRVKWHPDKDQLGDHLVSIQVDDGRGGKAIQSFGIKVEPDLDNKSPVFTTHPPSVAQVDQILEYHAHASDIDGDALTYSLSMHPDGMTIDESTGLIVWRPVATQVGDHEIIVRAQDGLGGATLQPGLITVQSRNYAPVFVTLAPNSSQVQSGHNFHFQPDAIDPDNDALNYSLVSSTTTGFEIEAATGLVTWKPDDSQLGPQQFTLLASDGNGGQAFQTIALTVIAPTSNHAPTFVSSPRTTTRIGSVYLYKPEAVDPNGDALTYHLGHAPAGMTLEQGLIRWQPSAEQAGHHAVTVITSDGRLKAEQTFHISVTHQASNRVPVITSAPDLTTSLQQLYAYNPRGEDPDGDVILWSLDQAPQGMVMDTQTGALRWQPNRSQIGHHTINIRLLDSYGESSTQSFVLTVNGVNSPPRFFSTPVTQASVDYAYTYTAAALDAENSRLAYRLGRHPSGMAIDAAGKVDWTPTEIGSYDVDILVTDPQNSTAIQTYRLDVGSSRSNLPPLIISTPEPRASLGRAYVYQLEASDPEGLALHYQLLASPQGMTIDAQTGLLMWPAPSIGNYQIVVAVLDPNGLRATQSFILAAKNNGSPVIRSTPRLDLLSNRIYRYDVQAVDPDNDSLDYELDVASLAKGMAIDDFGRLTWTPSNSQLGNHNVTLVITDEAGATVHQTFTLTVSADTTAPKVHVLSRRDLVSQGDSISFHVAATDDGGVANLQLLINDVPVMLDSQGIANYVAMTPGLIRATAVAFDAAGNRGEAVTTLSVFDPTDQEAPAVSLDLAAMINNPISSPVELKGSVNDTNLSYYSLEVAPADGTRPFTVMFRNTKNVNNGILGILDPTLLPNDTYEVRLTAYDTNGKSSSVSSLLDIAGNLKLGNFRVSFADLEISSGGLPITIVRTYDTLNSSTTNDFGYGWRMEYRDADLRTSLPRDELYEDLGLRSIGFKEGDSVYITLPGGKRERFTFQLKDYSDDPRINRLLGRRSSLYKPTFIADKGSPNILSVQTEGVALLRGEDGRIVPAGGGSAFAYYHPQDWGNYYRLTTKEGFVYTIDATSGDIVTVANRHGDMLHYSDGGIISSTGQQVTFDRDAQGHIVVITDPMGHRTTYTYDANGDLTSAVDREGNTTLFKYNDKRKHYLDAIIDPLGRTGVKTDYDDDTGRLQQTLNVFGESVQFEYSSDSSLYTVIDPLGNRTTYEYDVRGNIISEVDAYGGINRWTYDADNNRLTDTNAEGETSYSTYDRRGNRLTLTDAMGNTTYYAYNATSDLLSVVDSLGAAVTSTYDATGNPTSILGSPHGPIHMSYNDNGLLTALSIAHQTTTYDYDLNGNVVRETNPLGHTTTYTYNSNGDRLTEKRMMTSAHGHDVLITRSEYNSNGDLISVVDALGNITQMTYDANRNKVQEVDALGRVTKFVYDEAGNLVETILPDATSQTDADNPRTRKIYDASNRLSADIDELGRRTDYRYDALGRRTFTLFPDLTPHDDSDNPRRETRYDKTGRIIAEVDECGNVTSFEYDALGRRIRTILPDSTPLNVKDNPQISVTYDGLGRQLTQADPLGRATQFLYDHLGRQTGQIFADQTSILFAYDLAGRLVSKSDQLGNITAYEYSPLGQLTAVVDALGQRTEYYYNESGNIIAHRDPLGNVTSYEYDGLGRIIRTVLPLGQQAAMAYDAVGNLVRTTDFNQATTRLYYDERNRLVSRLYPDSSSTSFTYTLAGEKATELSALGLTTYAYDVRGNLLARVDPDSSTIEYGYDLANNRTSLSVSSGRTAYIYDENNRLLAVTDPQGGTTAYSYDLLGNLTRTSLPNGVVEVRDYDALNRLAYLENASPRGVINSFRYALDPVGNRVTILEDDGRRSDYSYDALYRLLMEKTTAGEIRSASYSYDAVGNRLTRADSLTGDTVYEYDANNRLLSEETKGIAKTYAYDQNGNIVGRSNGTSRSIYQWDADGNLVGGDTDGDGDIDIKIQYDASGTRVRQSVAGTETRFLVDKNRDYSQIIEEYSPGVVHASYVHGRDLISQLRGSAPSFYHVDGLGSTRALTNADADLIDLYDYSAFGEIVERAGHTPNDFLYAGELFDSDLNLVYLRSRYFDPAIARFVSMDEFNGILRAPATLHKYGYALNQPVNSVDPSGLFSLGEFGAASSVRDILADLQIDSGITLITNALDGGDDGSGYIGGAGWSAIFAFAGSAAPVLPRIFGGLEKSKKLTKVWEGSDISSRGLRNAMVASGRRDPGSGFDAHHIVPAALNDRYANEARAHLARAGIGANHPANGVFLPFPAHQALHSMNALYLPTIHERILSVRPVRPQAKFQEALVEVLNQIRRELQHPMWGGH